LLLLAAFVVGLALACTTTQDEGLTPGVDAARSSQSVEDATDPPVVDDPVDAPDLKKEDAPLASERPGEPPGKDAAPDGHPAAPDTAPVVDAAVDTRPATNLPAGAACERAAECKSGFCVDRVCCNNACNNGCQACTMARTGGKDGTCATATALESKPCGRACGGLLMGVPAVLEKVCTAGQCVLPVLPNILETCYEANNECIFCDNGSGRCVRNTCPSAGNCCCRSANGDRACVARNSCNGVKMCVQ
jgi:hypothetical protein